MKKIYSHGSLGSSFFNHYTNMHRYRVSNQISLISRPSKIYSRWNFSTDEIVRCHSKLYYSIGIFAQLMVIGLKDRIFLQLWLLFPQISRMNLTQPYLASVHYYATSLPLTQCCINIRECCFTTKTYFHTSHAKTTTFSHCNSLQNGLR